MNLALLLSLIFQVDRAWRVKICDFGLSFGTNREAGVRFIYIVLFIYRSSLCVFS